jgi:fatty-acyl-CoA synthase
VEPPVNLDQLKIYARMVRWLPVLAAANAASNRTAADLIERRARRNPTDIFVEFEGRCLTYSEFNNAANRIAHWAREKGWGKGDVVALLMENRPEYLMTWAGLAKVGATTALLNSNLTGKALTHLIEASASQALIVGTECLDSWNESREGRTDSLPVYVARGFSGEPAVLPPGAKSLDEEIVSYSSENLPRSIRADLGGADSLFYIFTSGTTGLPKAARFSHARFVAAGTYHLFSGFTRKDVLYCALPLYHTVAGVICVNAVLVTGARLALRRKFSASRFWQDVSESGATTFQYIGEVCRYLLGQPTGPFDRDHKIRYAVGNGLRPDIWEEFQERFGIERMVEFYGATESNVSLVNLEGRAGSVGRLMPGMTATLIRYDIEADEPVRGADGLCIACADDEPGELLGRIVEGKTAAGRFEGYTSEEATRKKILRDVRETGDAWFRSGDLLRRDADGFFYFVDRVGDTFRWKGENVSTQEVAEALSGHPSIELAVVYGVEVPGADGRAGMASVILSAGSEFDGPALFQQVEDALPTYARPAFLRLQEDVEMTGTFKVRKVELQREGFDPALVSAPLYFRDDEKRSYVPLNGSVHARILDQEIRF